MKKFGLSLSLIFLFSISITGQFLTGFKTYNEERKEEHLPALKNYFEYLKSGQFVSSVSENMESEFLQMGLFVLLTVFLYQKGASESKKLPDEKTEKDFEEDRAEEKYNQRMRARYPIGWPLYEYSLTIALFSLFVGFFFLHAYGSFIHLNEQKTAHGEAALVFHDIFSEPEFWFESFQNWQSEFFSIVSLCLLSIFLRQKNSAQSKKMRDPIWKTGSD